MGCALITYSWRCTVAGEVTTDTGCSKNILAGCRVEFVTMEGVKHENRCPKRLMKLHAWRFLKLDSSNLKLALL